MGKRQYIKKETSKRCPKVHRKYIKDAIYTLTQAQSLQRKECLSLWTKCPSFSKALLFLSVQTIQKRYRGAACHTFFLFLPIEEPYYPDNASLTEKGSTCDTLKRENKCHKILAISQCNRMCSSVSSFKRHR